MPPWSTDRPKKLKFRLDLRKTTINMKCQNILLILLVLIAAVLIPVVESACESGQWWDPTRDGCVKCKVCSKQELVLRPCQVHMDTVCGTISDLGDDFSFLARTEARRDRSWNEERLKESEETTEEILWDWQVTTLLLAVIACLLFFIFATIVSINYARQWKRMEKHFDSDIENLSSELKARLACMQNLENCSLILDDRGRFLTTNHPIEVRCVYLERLLADNNKDGVMMPQGPGNVYIEEMNNNSARNANNNNNSHVVNLY